MGVSGSVKRCVARCAGGLLMMGVVSCAQQPQEEPFNLSTPVAAGQVVRMDHLTNGSARRGWRMTYRSLDGQNAHQLVRVSAQVFLPYGTPPEGGWPIVAWAHGARGLSLACAPSVMGQSVTEQSFFDAWLRQGFAIVATDYQRLGEAGPVLFMHARSEGMDVLDAVRAARTHFRQLSSSVVLYGHSQGAQAVLAADGLAPHYAPTLTILGVIASAPPFMDVQGMEARLHPYDAEHAASTVPVMMSLAQSAADAGERMQGVFTARGQSFVQKDRSSCVEDFAPAVHRAGLTPAAVFTPSALQNFSQLAQDWTAYPSLSLKAPVLIGTGLNDHHNTAQEQDRLMRELCQAGSAVRQVHFSSANHSGTAHDMQPLALSFAEALRAGHAPSNMCAAP